MSRGYVRNDGDRVSEHETKDLSRSEQDAISFDAFVVEVEPALRRALVASFGAQRGQDALGEALAWAWEHRGSLAELRQPVGFLYRVEQTDRRRSNRGWSRAWQPRSGV
jgi:DNA-directed RNA polymerase specialized sigma24 family protein